MYVKPASNVATINRTTFGIGASLAPKVIVQICLAVDRGVGHFIWPFDKMWAAKISCRVFFTG